MHDRPVSVTAGRMPPSILIAGSLVVGVSLAEYFSLRIILPLISGWCCLLVSFYCEQQRPGRCSALALLAGFLSLGIALWAFRSPAAQIRGIERFPVAPEQTVQISGVVRSMAALRSQRDAASLSADQLKLRTVFLMSAEKLTVDDADVAVTGTLQVVVDGDATSQCGWGDRIVVPGRLQTVFTQQNPGEFDYQTFLNRQSCAGLLFVRHPLAIRGA